MVDTIPKIKVTDPPVKSANPFEKQSGYSATIEGRSHINTEAHTMPMRPC